MTEAPIHPVTEIQGIGGGLAAQLADRGILFDIDLLQLAPHWQAQMLADVSGLTYDGLIESVLPQAAFLRLPGMTGQMAEGITVSGYRTYTEFVMAEGTTVLGRLNDELEAGTINQVPDEQQLLVWQLEAGRRANSGTLYLVVSDAASGDAIEGATAEIYGSGHTNESERISATTDNRGVAFLEQLAPTNHAVRVSADGFRTRTATVGVHKEGHALLELKLEQGEDEPETADEFKGDIILNSNSFLLEEVTTDYATLAPPPPVHVHDMSSVSASLSSLWRYRVDDTVYIPRSTVSLDELPAEIAIGDVMFPNDGGGFTIQPGLTASDYRIQLVAERMAEGPA